MLRYEEYTKRNHVTKAVRFELIPQGRTLKTMEDKGDREYDKALYASLERLKPVIDSYIRFIASDALKSVDFDFSKMGQAYTEKDKKSFDKEEKALFKIISKAVDNAMPEGFKTSQINSAAFLKDALREYVIHTKDENIKKHDALKDIENTAGCLPLFAKFLTSRITALTTWMPDRVVENFKIYCDNIPKLEAILESGEFEDDYCYEAMTSYDYYGQVLSQDDIDGYNNIISGNSDENGTLIKGLNQQINEYNTKIKNEKLDRHYLKLISPLYKQILMPQEKKFVIESISTDDEAREAIRGTWESFKAPSEMMLGLLTEKNAQSGGSGIYVQGNKVHTLSHILTGDHSAISKALIEKESAEINDILSVPGLKPSMKKELEKRLEMVGNLVAKKNYELTELDSFITPSDNSILSQKKTAFEGVIGAYEDALKLVRAYYKVLEGGNIFDKRRIKGDRHVQEMLVDFYDALTQIRDILSLIRLPKDTDGDISFYNAFDEIYGKIRDTYKAENLLRNYITKSIKDIAEDKQTCLGAPARLRCQWWNGEKKFSKDMASIIKHEDKYYYFILAGDAKPVEIKEADTKTGFLTLKKGQKSFMMLPKILFTDHALPFFKENPNASEYVFDDAQVVRPVIVTREVFDIYKNGLFKREAVTGGNITEDEYKENIAKLIKTYIDFARAYVQYQKFGLDVADIDDVSAYGDIGEFFSVIDTYTSNLSWTFLDFNQIEALVSAGEGYLFLISNRFLYTGNEDKNPYTKIFLSILSDVNMERTTVLLNSNPAVYFRPQAIENKVTHKKGSILVNRRTEDGEPIPKRIYETIYKMKNNISSVTDEDVKAAEKYLRAHNVRTHIATEDLSHKKNYMSDKYILQLTYTKNNDISDRIRDMLNDRVNEAIKDGFNIISVARTTKDMLYVMALDSSLNVLEERSLNVIDGIDYYALLHDTYLEKKEDKKVWIYDTENADIKSSYLELAITNILKMAKKYNAVIVVESISDVVKDKYAFLDNQVFRAFENRLAARLSDLSFKDILDGRAGSVSNPLQLSNNSGNTYQDGILFFINGAYTRGVDPESGFTNIFDMGRINSIASKRQFLSKMDDIRFTGDSFEFTFDYKNYPVRYETEKSKWTVKLSGSVVSYDREKKESILIDDVCTDILIPLAGKTDLDGNLAKQVMTKDVPGAFVEELFKWFRYTIYGMHSDTKNTDEFFKSPVSGREYSISSSLAKFLAQKLLFRMEYAGEAKDFTTQWLNYIQVG